ncbi:MAG: hypothetical protein V4576_01255 [Patescibacteria group bacterium]
MKYHKRIVTGAFALSLLVGGSSVKTYADSVTAQSGVSGTSTRSGALHFKNLKNARLKINHKVGVITSVGASGFTFDVYHGHNATSTATATKILSIDVGTTATTTVKKDGAAATFADLAVGQKVIVSGSVDSTGHIISAKRVDVVTNLSGGVSKKKGKVIK